MIYLNVDNTEMILLKPTKKPLECQLKLNLNGKRIYQTSSSVKYLGIEIDQHLHWQDLFFSRTFTIHRTEYEGEGYFFNSFLPFSTTSTCFTGTYTLTGPLLQKAHLCT